MTILIIQMNPSAGILSAMVKFWSGAFLEAIGAQVFVRFLLLTRKEKWKEWENKGRKGEVCGPLGYIVVNTFFEIGANGPCLLSSPFLRPPGKFWKTVKEKLFYMTREWSWRKSYLDGIISIWFPVFYSLTFTTLTFQRFLFKLQYKAIIKPEQLGIDSSAPETKI
jgi:hypothetical protein